MDLTNRHNKQIFSRREQKRPTGIARRNKERKEQYDIEQLITPDDFNLTNLLLDLAHNPNNLEKNHPIFRTNHMDLQD
jgi:hypothetical protein